MNTSSLYKQILGFLSHRQSLEEDSVLKRAEPLAAVITRFISSVPRASVNGNVVQHITTVLEPGAANYTGI